MNLEIGDEIVGIQSHNKDIVRRITKVRPTGYSWIYPDLPDKEFKSENSNDPHFEMGWKLIR